MRVNLTGPISTDGDTIYVDGQNLANIIRAAFPAPYTGSDGSLMHGVLVLDITKGYPTQVEQARTENP